MGGHRDREHGLNGPDDDFSLWVLYSNHLENDHRKPRRNKRFKYLHFSIDPAIFHASHYKSDHTSFNDSFNINNDNAEYHSQFGIFLYSSD